MFFLQFYNFCNESYYSECVRHLNVTTDEHIAISPITITHVKAKNNSAANHSQGILKTSLQETAFTSYSVFDKDNSLPFNLNKDEFESLCKMKNVNNIVISDIWGLLGQLGPG